MISLNLITGCVHPKGQFFSYKENSLQTYLNFTKLEYQHAQIQAQVPIDLVLIVLELINS